MSVFYCLAASGLKLHLINLFRQLAREILDVAAEATVVGVTTDEIDRLVHEVRLCLFFSVAFHFVSVSCTGTSMLYFQRLFFF